MNPLPPSRKFCFAVLKGFLCAFLLLASLPVFADLKIIYKERHGDSPGAGSSTVLLIKGNRTRAETNSGGARQITITWFDINRVFLLRGKEKTYSVMPIDAMNTDASRKAAAKAAWGDEVLTPAERARKQLHGKVVFVTKLEDTGERRVLFGQTARHIKAESYMQVSTDACQTPNDTKQVTDAWVIDWPQEIGLAKERFIDLEAIPVVPDPACRDEVQTASLGSAKAGLVVLSDSKYVLGKAIVEDSASHFEIVEISNTPVDAALFQVPPDYSENQEGIYGSAIVPSVRGLIPADRKYALPLKIGVGPFSSKVLRNVKLQDMRSRLLTQLKELEVTVADLNGSTVEEALAEGRQKRLDYVITGLVWQADVPDDDQDTRPPYGVGSLEYRLYDVPSGKPAHEGSGLSGQNMVEAAVDVAYRVFNDVAQERVARQQGTAAQLAAQQQNGPIILISLSPTISDAPIDKNALREQLIAELTKEEYGAYGRGVRIQRLQNKNDVVESSGYARRWLLTTEWKAGDKVSQLQFSLVPLLPGASSAPSTASGAITYSATIAASDPSDAVHQASDAIASEIKKEITAH